VQVAGQDVVFVKKGGVQIECQGNTLIGKNRKASFKLGDRILKGTISPENFAKYELWKNE